MALSSSQWVDNSGDNRPRHLHVRAMKVPFVLLWSDTDLQCPGVLWFSHLMFEMTHILGALFSQARSSEL